MAGAYFKVCVAGREQARAACARILVFENKRATPGFNVQCCGVENARSACAEIYFCKQRSSPSLLCSCASLCPCRLCVRPFSSSREARPCPLALHVRPRSLSCVTREQCSAMVWLRRICALLDSHTAPVRASAGAREAAPSVPPARVRLRAQERPGLHRVRLLPRHALRGPRGMQNILCLSRPHCVSWKMFLSLGAVCWLLGSSWICSVCVGVRVRVKSGRIKSLCDFPAMCFTFVENARLCACARRDGSSFESM